MSKLEQNLLPSVSALAPYTWEDSSEAIRAKYGVKRVMRFDANTMPTPPGCYDRFLNFLATDRQVNEYKDFDYQALAALVGQYTGIDPSNVVVTNSGDEGLDVVGKAFLADDDQVVISSPTYSMYAISTRVNGGKVIDVPLRLPQFELDVEGILSAAKQAKIIYLCSPNNPTGTVIPRATIERIIGEAACMVLVDEAYFEFNDRKSVQDLIDTNDNLIILRTFSKFAAIAGARVGYLLTHAALASKLNALRFPMGVSYFSMELATMVLAEDMDWVRSNLAMILRERDRMAAAYHALSLEFIPSKANFMLVNFGQHASTVATLMKARGLILRDVSRKKGTEDYLRIGIRSAEENTVLIQALGEVQSELVK